ncbi:BREX system ATP-binding protein BrxD [Corynebacterium glyciniphilum]|uniref:BREX system ATP-binding protein BrxD n=1 Tax=Corynebacterium glyciniphilum TaxID=1404244 RepID=UPI00264A5ACA|nr:BREX system ATP-binding protein BrxD [Corynebacterium glyciniphilum]MDN6706344.1 BREX system ATP-binding protein BrxD [Corynebacterium glyciniphilum]
MGRHSTGGLSPARRRNILSALRRGTVPADGLDQLAVGLDHLSTVVGDELSAVAGGAGMFKAVRGEYGSGKTFAARWIEQRALAADFAVAEVQISETDTPLHKLETVYRRTTEELRTTASPTRAFRDVLDAWLAAVDADAENSGRDRGEVIDERLSSVAQVAPVFPLALRGYLRAVEDDDVEMADGLAAWLGGQSNVSSSVKRFAGIKGELDKFTATGFLRGLVEILRGSDHSGLLLVLDEVETLQRMRTDTREKSLNALRQWLDEISNDRYPGLYLLITGTTAFFEGGQGVKRLQPLYDRLRVDFSGDPRWDNPRDVQIRLQSFDHDRLVSVGRRGRDIFVDGLPSEVAERVDAAVDDGYIADLAESVAGELGGRIGVAPRIFLRTVVDVLDRVELHPDFNPREHYTVKVNSSEEERAAGASPTTDPDDIEF